MKGLLYYFALPHYRREIVKNLVSQSGGNVEVAAGTIGREHIKPLTKTDIETMDELESVGFGPISWQRGVVRRAISGKYESVILGPATMSLSTWMILFSRRILRKRTYLWGQCGRLGERTPKRFVQEIMNRLATGLLVYGDSEARAACELGLAPEKVHVVQNATRSNLELIESQSDQGVYERVQRQAKAAAEDGAITLLYVGRLVESKRVDVLLEAGKLLSPNFEKLRIIVVGGGVELESLRANYSQPYVDFRDWIYDEDQLNGAIRDATLVVSPYHIGLLAVDALRVGTPVLVPNNPHNGPEFESLTLGTNALMFTAGDSKSLAQAVETWVEVAPEIPREKFIAARTESLKIWTPEHVASRILEVVER